MASGGPSLVEEDELAQEYEANEAEVNKTWGNEGAVAPMEGSGDPSKGSDDPVQTEVVSPGMLDLLLF